MNKLVRELRDILKEENFNEIKGNKDVKNHLKSALIMNRHVIIIGPPGIGKTSLAKSVAKLLNPIKVMDCGFNCLKDKTDCPICKDNKSKEITLIDRFVRIQGSPDLNVEDLIGDIDPIKALKFGPLSIEAFTPGKIFRANHGILFFDEVNRCPERLQNALLQVLEEGKVTIGNYSFELPTNFILIATMNPEDNSTEKLSDVFLDRIDSIYMTYPENLNIEKEIIKMKENDDNIIFPEELLNFVISFIQELRRDNDIDKKPSVRATIGIFERAKSNAMINNRNKVNLNDIKYCMLSVLSHRIRIKSSLKYLKTQKQYLEDKFKTFLEKNPDLEDNKESDLP